MLRSDPLALRMNFVLSLLAAMNGGGPPRQVQMGVVQISHYGSSDYLPGYDHWPELTSVSCFGVTDTLESLLSLAREEVVEGPRTFLITITPVRKRDQAEEGGWRWHKWGPYIGHGKPSTEYLHDEPPGVFDEIFVYRIYERISR